MTPGRLALFVTLFLAVPLAGCWGPEERYDLRYYVAADDGKVIFEILLSHPDFKDVADRVAPVTVRAEVLQPYNNEVVKFDYRYADGSVTLIPSPEGRPDFTLSTSRDVALGVLNSDEPFHVFACAMKANAATLDATNPIYAASFNSAKGRILDSASDCQANAGDTVTFRGLSGTLAELGGGHLIARMMISEDYPDFLMFNQWRAPVGWSDNLFDILCDLDATGSMKSICEATPGTSAPSTALNDCAEAVRKAYLADVPPAGGWDAGEAAARASREATEKALCNLTFGGRA